MYKIIGFSYKGTLLVAIVLIMLSCQSWKNNVFQSSKETDSVKIYFDVPTDTEIGVFKSKKCEPYSLGTNISKALLNADTFTHKEINKIIPFYNKSRVGTKNIRMLKFPPGKQLTISYYYSGDMLNVIASCYSSRTFVPEKGNRYIIRLTIGSKGCLLYTMDVNKSLEENEYRSPSDLKASQGKSCI